MRQNIDLGPEPEGVDTPLRDRDAESLLIGAEALLYHGSDEQEYVAMAARIRAFICARRGDDPWPTRPSSPEAIRSVSPSAGLRREGFHKPPTLHNGVRQCSDCKIILAVDAPHYCVSEQGEAP